MNERKGFLLQKVKDKLDPYLSGAAHILDLGGTLRTKLTPYDGLSREEQTRLAMKTDKEKIAGDYQRARDKLDEELRKKGITPPERKDNNH